MPTKFFEVVGGHVEIRVTPSESDPTGELMHVDMQFPRIIRTQRVERLLLVMDDVRTHQPSGGFPQLLLNIIALAPPTPDDPQRLSFSIDTMAALEDIGESNSRPARIDAAFAVCEALIRFVSQTRDL